MSLPTEKSYLDPPPAPEPKPALIECVVTCVNYGDFLAQSLPHNRVQFDRLVVVTSPEDKHTQAVCDFNHVECIPTDAFRSHWDEFHKGAGINVGLAALSKRGWLVQMDADIVLPQPGLRFAVERGDFDKSGIYGVDRATVGSWDEWQSFLQQPIAQKQGQAFVHPRAFELGCRLCIPDWVPIGYFQMWNVASGVLSYPEGHSDATHEDALFALQWPRAKRHLIPEFYAYHLESERGPMGANWKGRTTKFFGVTQNGKTDY